MKNDPAIVVDLDGTLCNTDHRLHHLKQEPKNWQAFFDGCVDDPIHEDVLHLIRMSFDYKPHGYNCKITVFLCSGRPDSHRRQTTGWLFNHGVPYDNLLMRKTGDHRPDTVVKKEMLDSIQQKYDVLFAVDDRPDVIQMWRDNGIACFVVENSSWF